MNSTRCDKCGQELHIGDFPFCPHGVSNLVVDNFPPRFDEHIAPEGAYITSARQRRKIMSQNQIDYRGIKAGMPGCEV